ncbi:hypothetical protein BX600DRAFT_428600 [Xylariales sp. PMI_506]|nr:hypothetical protein BX600DRAFT_428600 [Xylariales sp. PMI_506]
MTTTAWDCRDQADQAEEYYNHPLRVRNKQLEDENVMLKRLLREKGISWPSASNRSTALRSRVNSQGMWLPHLPAEIMLKVLCYALTSPFPIINPLCSARKEHQTSTENSRSNQIAIHFLATCRAYYHEGQKFLWTNNTFTFTTVQAVRVFSEVNPVFRDQVRLINLRVIARFYDDEDRIHTIPRTHHQKITKAIRLKVTKRPKETTLARRGFRSYGWSQLIDFLEALLPPHNPMHDASQPRRRLLPSLERMRIDLVNFPADMFQYPPPHLHDVSSHQLGCYLNELVVTGLPRDDSGHRVGHELSGMLKADGLFIDHAPTLVSLKKSLRILPGNHFHPRVVRAMRRKKSQDDHYDDDDPGNPDIFPPAPADEGEPPFSEFSSCRTIWKKIPASINDLGARKWTLFDRVSGLPWEDVEEEMTMFDLENDEDSDGLVCENCGEIHPGVILSDDAMDDLYVI